MEQNEYQRSNPLVVDDLKRPIASIEHESSREKNDGAIGGEGGRSANKCLVSLSPLAHLGGMAMLHTDASKKEREKWPSIA